MHRTLRTVITADDPAVRACWERDLVLVASDEQNVIGCAIVRSVGPEWELGNIVVAPQSRRHGAQAPVL